MTEAEQRANGAAAQGRHAAGTPQAGSRFSRGTDGSAQGRGYSASSGYGNAGSRYGNAGSGYGSASGGGNGSPTSNSGYSGAGYGNGSQAQGSRFGSRYGSDAGAGGYGNAGGYGSSNRGASNNAGYQPRTVSRNEAEDVNRYRQMRQTKDEGKLRRAVRRGQEALPSAGGRGRSGVGGQLAGARQPRSFDAKRALKYTKRGLIGLLCALLAFALVITVRMNLGVSLETRLALTPTLPGQPFYMLLVGTDKDSYREETGETGGVYRTDSIILARVDPIQAKLTLVSIQRDTLVDLGDDYGEQKINAAYALGGPPMLIKAVSSLAGVNISHYAEIDLDQFISVVDAIGGITVNVPVDCYDPEYTGADIKAGVQTLNGDDALKLCRARHAYDQYGAGDYYRTANQRMVLGAILKKSLSGNPFTFLAVMNAGSSSVNTTLTGFDLMFLGLRFVGFNADNNLYSALEPTVSSYENNTWYERVNEEAWTTMMNRVDQGLSPYEDASQDTTAGIAAGAA